MIRNWGLSPHPVAYSVPAPPPLRFVGKPLCQSAPACRRRSSAREPRLSIRAAPSDGPAIRCTSATNSPVRSKVALGLPQASIHRRWKWPLSSSECELVGSFKFHYPSEQSVGTKDRLGCACNDTWSLARFGDEETSTAIQG